MTIGYVLFDFDGTLFDTSPGIIACARFALESNGFTVERENDLKQFVGPPLAESFHRFFGADAKQTSRLIKAYRALYAEQGMYACQPFEGALDFLKHLRSFGIRTAVATSKPVRFAVPILRRFGFEDYFDAICGVEEDDRKTKTEIIAEAMKKLSADPKRTVMIGDRLYDVMGARDNGIDCIGLDSGFAEEGELEGAGAVCIVKTYADLQHLFFDSESTDFSVQR